MSTFVKAAVIILLATIGSGPATGLAEAPTNRAPTPEIGIVAVDATIEQSARLEQAVARFEELGLALPAIRVYFNDSTENCKGHAGLYTRASQRTPWNADTIQICHRSQTTLIHELAHGWAHATIDDDRKTQLLAGWGLKTWNDHDVEWGERGTERVAQTITAALILESPSDNPNILRKVCSYELLTGYELPNPALFDCTSAEVPVSPRIDSRG